MSQSATDAPQNRLRGATSPYLRQHASNPVDWYEWGPEALGRAAREDRPILLSVGYSACHWCHVMAHESFEDAQTAALINERFISIKVDREERPDVDAIYQKVVQMMGQGGGWPLTVFLTPDQRPFYGGTYFPKDHRYGRPSFQQVLLALSNLYTNEKEDLDKQVGAFMDGYQKIGGMLDEQTGDADLGDPLVLRGAAKWLLERVDDEWGGFGREPKFPNATALEILARAGRRGDSAIGSAAATALHDTLVAMYRGGIYDHLRGGFARYSVDRVWLVPHFEKMLYDNAQLIGLYADASVMWPDDTAMRKVVIETIDYLVHDMTALEGTFYAATDADSEGEEGKYFVWTPPQLAEVLGGQTAELVGKVYDVTDRGNFEHGSSILHLARNVAERAEELGTPAEELESRLTAARAKLLEHRYGRVAPLRDDKVLTSWNALLASGLARAAQAAEVWGDDERVSAWTGLAEGAVERLASAHVQGVFDHPDGRGVVMRAAFEGRVHTRGVLDDVAYLARACLDLHELTLQPKWRERGAALARHAIAHYGRESDDGFYFTADDGEALIERSDSQNDGPIPSGVGVMLEVLLRLDAAGSDVPSARTMTEGILKRFALAAEQPFAFASILTAATRASPSAVHVTVRGPAPDDPLVVELALAVRKARLSLPNPVSLSFEPADTAEAIACRGQACSVPLRHAAMLVEELG